MLAWCRGRPCNSEAFHNKLRSSSCPLGANPPKVRTPLTSRNFAHQEGCNPLAPPIAKMRDYLMTHCDRGLGPCVINTVRSALSNFVLARDGNPIGKQPLVISFVRDFFHNRPSLPQTGVTWDTNVVLEYLQLLTSWLVDVAELFLRFCC